MFKKRLKPTPATAGILIAFYSTMTPILAKPKPNTAGVKNEAMRSHSCVDGKTLKRSEKRWVSNREFFGSLFQKSQLVKSYFWPT